MTNKEYTAWRRFLAWVGLIAIVTVVVGGAYLLISDVQSICLIKIS